jgi:hypothetical protein
MEVLGGFLLCLVMGALKLWYKLAQEKDRREIWRPSFEEKERRNARWVKRHWLRSDDR